MSRFIGGRGGDVVPVNPGTALQPAVYTLREQYYASRLSAWPAQSGLTATGGVISDYNDGGTIYRAHIFTSSGALNVTDLGEISSTIEYLVVAGGGGGGGRGGGGGAGGLRSTTDETGGGGSLEGVVPVAVAPYSVVVGGGGGASGVTPVSYTHLTLPTILLV